MFRFRASTKRHELRQESGGPEIACGEQVAEGRHEVSGDRRATGEKRDQPLCDPRSPDGALKESRETPLGSEFAPPGVLIFLEFRLSVSPRPHAVRMCSAANSALRRAA